MKQEKKRVFLTGKDNFGWAMDSAYYNVQNILKDTVELVDKPEDADYIHAIFWDALLHIDKQILKNKIVYSHLTHDLWFMLSKPYYLKVAPYIDKWVVFSSRAKKSMDLLGLNSIQIPYTVDNNVFYEIKGEKVLNNIYKEFNLPENKYLIGSFQRDTEGYDLKTPKLVKGPDVFLEIVKGVYQKNPNIHVVLAGPRRFWLRGQLEKFQIPFTFVGENIIGRDDLKENTLNREIINKLYNVIDLYVIGSRMEGGPQAVLESCITQTKLISTDVGIVPDVLNKSQIYSNHLDAIDFILKDIESSWLSKYLIRNFEEINKENILKREMGLRGLYPNNPPQQKARERRKGILLYEIPSYKKNIIQRIFGDSITINYQTRDTPWGGANQFIKSLAKALQKKGLIIKNKITLGSHKILLNSFHFDVNEIKKLKRSKQYIVHRVDGPTYLARGKDLDLDKQLFNINKKIASVTIFQSIWSLKHNLLLNFQPINPVLITNASDPDVFNQEGKSLYKLGSKLKLVSTSWSSNPKKGLEIYKWLDQNLDFDNIEYTFVGNIDAKLQNIKVLPATTSENLAKILKQHDIYITASQDDSCSNALIEALSCGLPSIFLKSGGHPEIVGFGGLGFINKEEIPALIKKISSNYESFKSLLHPPSIVEIADNYIKAFNIHN